MKKIYMILVLAMVLFLQSCGMIVIEEDTNEYRLLSDQYNAYIMHDVVSFDDFKDIMNDATNQTTLSVFMLEKETFNRFNSVTDRKYGTATLIYFDQNYLYLLTTFEMIDLNSQYINYYVHDAYGTEYEGEIYAADSSYSLGIIRVERTGVYYPKAKLADYLPLTNEMVLMISNDHPSQNIHRLGYYLNQNDQSYVEMISSMNANGSPVFNLQLELIGIQYLYGDAYILLIDYQTIYTFVSDLLPI
ncbi:hypothetical protein BK010_08595 [Tenericutes bacterium MO-XQ]|nr:hypothetical protein BK010_08085 [Tenericutes bacterium MO-XQ]AUD63646.1 hypothetical protein BK010_08595 [Tenericutes bacterium MO-XQ]